MDVARRLRTARLAAGLTQQALAAHAHVSRVSVARYEAGTVMPRADVYLRLLAACRLVELDPLDEHDLALIDAQLLRRPEDRLHASQELARLRRARTRA